MPARNNFDLVILEIFEQDKGFFIEAGGGHPVHQSNTFYLEKKGWNGIVVEPRDKYNKLYRVHRSNSILENYALVAFDYPENKIKFRIDQDCDGFTSCVSDSEGNHLWRKKDATNFYVIDTPCITLQSILNKHKVSHVNVLSLDAEGYEYKILQGIDFAKTYFDIIAVEHSNGEEKQLFDCGFRLNKELGQRTNSSFYIHKDSKFYE